MERTTSEPRPVRGRPLGAGSVAATGLAARRRHRWCAEPARNPSCTALLTAAGPAALAPPSGTPIPAPPPNSACTPCRRGIIPRLLESLFARFRNPQIEFDVRCSCVEIYNETVFDLITYGKNNVEIWEDKDRGLTLMGATEVPIVSCAAALALVREAVKNRHTYETAMNATSSRSHCVFVLTVAKRVRSETATTFCQLYLADLAGSERVAKTQVSGDRLGEAKYINKSLLALGKVISALSDPGRDETAAGARAGRGAAGGAGSAAGHIPYRDSKLTRLLQNSLGGNSRTVLLIALSPSAWNASESLGTLRFGDMSSRIQNTAVARTLVSEERLADMIALARERRTRNDSEPLDQRARFEAAAPTTVSSPVPRPSACLPR